MLNYSLFQCLKAKLSMHLFLLGARVRVDYCEELLMIRINDLPY